MQNKYTGFTCGAFDLFHAGHVVMLKECYYYLESCCGYKESPMMIVGLQSNPKIDRNEKNKPVQSIYERYTQLIGCRYIDKIIPYDSEKDLLNLLSTVNIDVRFVGEEYKNKDFTGKSLCKDLKIDIHYTDRKHDYSSSELRRRLSFEDSIF